MASNFEYGEKESKHTERAYLAPEVVRQRMRTLEVLAPRSGENIIDIGCGPGLLVHDLATEVGTQGCVVGVDTSPAMLELAERRCADLPQVAFAAGDATNLAYDDATFDAAACIQVLLYIDDTDRVLAEICRVLKPGGRVLLMETDWRGMVLSSDNQALSAKMAAAWGRKVPSPNLPVRLGPLLREHGFAVVAVEAFPILSTSYRREGYSAGMLAQFASLARKEGTVSETDSRHWLNELKRQGAEDAYFFCVNRFLFLAVKR
ncbi:MAG: methyltransferase domain-containing protein [Gammaproteobacteria bacterium]|nr:methyltransferase domain-containing protein [Gammaproteobacteria bacterium]